MSAVVATRELLRLEDLSSTTCCPPAPCGRSTTSRSRSHLARSLGLAGESGCGKSTIANAMMQILKPPARVSSGRIMFRGDDLAGMSPQELRKVRWRHVSLVFQSAMNVLNPVMRVGDQFVDMYRAHDRIRRSEALSRAGDLLELVGIDRGRIRSYPHELSGGMRQRVVIAMALALEPELIVMDEPTTALDVVVQREILQELETLKKRLGFAVLFITHDLSLLVEFSDRIGIMYAGEIVESAASEVAVPSAAPSVHGGADALVPAADGSDRAALGHPGLAPEPRAATGGLPLPSALSELHGRGSPAVRRQTTERPLLREIEPEHRVACHLVDPA